MTPPLIIDAEDFWDDLLAFIEERQVIPIVGGELLEVNLSGNTVPLYRAVAERLLTRYGMTPAHPNTSPRDLPAGHVILRPQHELNDAVCAFSRSGKRIQDLYRPVNDALKAVVDEQANFIPEALIQLAKIKNFDLFVSTTCDDMLLRAINSVRYNGSLETEQIEFAPNLSINKDIPENRSKSYTAIFNIFGRASALPQFAIHDEDTLEFVYILHSGRGNIPERMLGSIRSRNLLLIGCNFSDWLGRFFIRGTNQTRLSGDRSKKEFMADTIAAPESSLTLFLERFSQNTRVFPGSAKDFVNELSKRWFERHPADEPPAAGNATVNTSTRRGEIFVSYASEDRPAARLLVEAIEKIGGNVVWFDRHDLAAGDKWQSIILSSINRCSLFIPVVSINTESRNEGFFRVEWDEASERDRKISGRKFIMPVAVNSNPEGAEIFQLIPDCFRKYQFSHAPGGIPSERLVTDLIAEIRERQRQGTP